MAFTSRACSDTDGRDQPDIPALAARRPHRSATVGSPARGSRLFGALMEPGGQAVTRAGPAGAPVGAPLRRVLLSGGLATALNAVGLTRSSRLGFADELRLGLRGTSRRV